MSPCAFRQITERQRTDRDTHEAQYFGTARLDHSSDLPVFPLFELDHQPAMSLSSSQDIHLRRTQHIPLVSRHAGTQRFEQRRVGHSTHLHMVRLANVRRRCSDGIAPLRVIREQQQSFAGLIEPTHRTEERERRI